MKLYEHQQDAIGRLHSGCILCGGVGTGKSLTALGYFWQKVCEDGKKKVSLTIITTARKRDTGEWEEELEKFDFSSYDISVDSWNNIGKHDAKTGGFFIFDEQRVVGSGAWVKSFLRISRNNQWILLSATPGDTWMDYIPVFLANGFYKNRTAFLRRHAIYNRYSRFPKVDKWVDVHRLETLRRSITVTMEFQKKTKAHRVELSAIYDISRMNRVAVDRWNIWEERPVKEIGELCHCMRRVCGEDMSRIDAVKRVLMQHPKLIIFYNFDFELEMLKENLNDIPLAEWNGHKHQSIPEEKRWVYLVQYTAGAEGWNCVSTDAMLFYSQNYSYKLMTQAAGRIDRMNTKYTDLYYYTVTSDAPIEKSIQKALKGKKTFNEKLWVEQMRFAT